MQPFDSQMEAGRLYAGLSRRKQKLAFARAGIRAMSEIASRTYASISFGKQSICLAHMLYQVNPDIPMFFLASSESWVFHNYAEVIDAFMVRWPIKLTIVQTNNAGLDLDEYINPLKKLQPDIEWDCRYSERAKKKISWQESRDLGDSDLQNMVDREDWDGWYWGLSKEESRGRRMTLSYRWPGQPHPAIFKYKDGKYRCCPLANWDILDIAAYVDEYDIPLLNVYKTMGLEMRTTARITRLAAELGGVAYFKHTNVGNFNEIAARFPELRGYF